MKYILKDGGDIRYKGITQEDITLFKKLSVKKNKYKESVIKLEEEFFRDSMITNKEFARRYVNLQLDYGHTMQTGTQRAYILKMVLKRDRQLVHGYVDDMFNFSNII